MGWRQFARTMEASSRRHRRAAERAATVRHRELQKRAREVEKAAEQDRAAQEVAEFENYLELLVSVHKDCEDSWDWDAVSRTAGPAPPRRASRHEAAAASALQAYKPGLLSRLVGGGKSHLAELNKAVTSGRDTDQAAYQQAVIEHHAAMEAWQVARALATRVVARDASAYADALQHVNPFIDVSAFQTLVALASADADVATVTCELLDPDLVPREEVKLTASGKLTSKPMAAGRYWSLYQDHVCSCATRIAREVFGALPVSRVIVNVNSTQLNTTTGHEEPTTLLAVNFLRERLTQLNLEAIDPSDSLKNFPHRMTFKKTSGFQPVTPMTADEQWITT